MRLSEWVRVGEGYLQLLLLQEGQEIRRSEFCCTRSAVSVKDTKEGKVMIGILLSRFRSIKEMLGYASRAYMHISVV